MNNKSFYDAIHTTMSTPTFLVTKSTPMVAKTTDSIAHNYLLMENGISGHPTQWQTRLRLLKYEFTTDNKLTTNVKLRLALPHVMWRGAREGTHNMW